MSMGADVDLEDCWSLPPLSVWSSPCAFADHDDDDAQTSNDPINSLRRRSRPFAKRRDCKPSGRTGQSSFPFFCGLPPPPFLQLIPLDVGIDTSSCLLISRKRGNRLSRRLMTRWTFVRSFSAFAVTGGELMAWMDRSLDFRVGFLESGTRKGWRGAFCQCFSFLPLCERVSHPLLQGYRHPCPTTTGWTESGRRVLNFHFHSAKVPLASHWSLPSPSSILIHPTNQTIDTSLSEVLSA